MLKYDVIRLTASGIVSRKPCHIAWVLITNNTTGTTVNTFYDGSNIQSDVLCVLKVTTNITQRFTFNPEWVTTQGLYIALYATTSEIIVCIAYE